MAIHKMDADNPRLNSFRVDDAGSMTAGRVEPLEVHLSPDSFDISIIGPPSQNGWSIISKEDAIEMAERILENFDVHP